MSPGWILETMVDVGGLEPPTSSLRIQKANLDDVEKSEKK
jgi:hypothetical protein